jgi:transcriptional regulator of acetoin/glycerol metabolism
MIHAESLTPLMRSVLDVFTEPALVFDNGGRLVFANQAAHRSLASTSLTNGASAPQMMPRLTTLGATVRAVWIGETKVGDVVVLPSERSTDTLAERERRAILDTLESTGWRLTAAARKLGISRTTLWRRLKRYGHNRDGRSKWSSPS